MVWSSSILHKIVCDVLKLATDFCFKACEAIWLTPLDTLEPSFFILYDYNGTVAIGYSTAIATITFSILLVKTLPDEVLVIFVLEIWIK